MKHALLAFLVLTLVVAGPRVGAADDSAKGEAQVRDAVTLALDGARFRLSSLVPFDTALCGGKDCAERAAEVIGPEVAGRQVTCNKERRLGHGYFLARCVRDDGVDLALVILAKGFAKAEPNAPPSYVAAAAEAKAKATGLWAN